MARRAHGVGQVPHMIEPQLLGSQDLETQQTPHRGIIFTRTQIYTHARKTHTHKHTHKQKISVSVFK